MERRPVASSVNAEANFCYLTTTGRRTRRPHTIEIWFAQAQGTLYLLAGGGERADWVRNLMAEPEVRVAIGNEDQRGTARVVEQGSEEDAVARRLVLEKYQEAGSHDLERWGGTALAVAIDLVVPE